METGCVFDNHRGIYMGEAIIGLAESIADYHCEPEDRTHEGEWHFEAVDEAIAALNDYVAEAGKMFDYGESGDFMYMPIEWWDEEN